jgi:hypothetical protein
MKSYSELEIFTEEEVRLFHMATKLVEGLTRPVTLRCHELARAVGAVLGLEHQDGFYGFVNHTWLWTKKPEWNELNTTTRLGFPNILDVYSVGSLPMVRLVDGKHTSLPHVGWAYRPDWRSLPSLDRGMVSDLVAEFTRPHE